VTKYEVPDGYWSEDEPEHPPAWCEDTSASDITIDVELHEQGYQNDRRWSIHLSDRTDSGDGVVATHAVEHRNKGNFWRDGRRWDDAVDFVDLPRRVRRRVAAVLNRDLDVVTPDERLVHREDGTGLADRNDGGETT
jgi:hypothetical protein